MDKLMVISHLIYECKKGVRSAALCTLRDEYRESAVSKLKASGMAYFICPVAGNRINVFFGTEVCIDVISSFCNKPLNKLSPEEDFMLGAILGYGISEQCLRYRKMNERASIFAANAALR
ncbi:MAG: DUF2023 family protein [Prevotellaceae bacterium]|jgi:hypothetical protein|nr:DUF2023 family protein [Prevotellaceae bacterium]